MAGRVQPQIESKYYRLVGMHNRLVRAGHHGAADVTGPAKAIVEIAHRGSLQFVKEAPVGERDVHAESWGVLEFAVRSAKIAGKIGEQMPVDPAGGRHH